MLEGPEPRIGTAGGQQLAGRALLDHPAAVEDHHPVGPVGHVEVVRHRQHRPPLGGQLEGVEHRLLGGRVQPAGGLVQQQHRGVPKDRPGQRDPPPLPPGQPHPALPDLGAPPIGEPLDQLV